MKHIAGLKSGRLTAIKPVGINKWGNYLWLCKCDCGKEHIVSSGKLIQGSTTSCGCFSSEVRIAQLEKHGLTTGGKPRTFTIWNGMKARCLYPTSPSYKNYGARGITICDEWMSFENFHNWAISNGYEDMLTLDRIDNDKGYGPDNCRWVSKEANFLNQRRHILFTIGSKTMPLCTWAREIKISRWQLTKYYKIAGKEKTETAIHDCLVTGKGEAYFVNRFLRNK